MQRSRPAAVARPLDRLSGRAIDGEEIDPVDLGRRHAKRPGAFDDLASHDEGLGGRLAETVVLDGEDDRQLPDLCEIHALRDNALIDRATPEKATETPAAEPSARDGRHRGGDRGGIARRRGAEAAKETMRLLARSEDDDPAIVSGESGCAATAGFLAAAADPAMAAVLGLGPDARVAVIGSEGATDADIYAGIVG